MEFIKNHFEIDFDEENIYYTSLLYNSDFEYLKDCSIKRFETNPSVYNFLFEIQELYKNDNMQIDGNGHLIIPINTFMGLYPESMYNLTLKEPTKFTLSIKSWGDIKYNTFNFTYEIQEKKYQKCEIVGCFAKKNDEFYLLDKNLYLLLKSIKEITNIPNDENKDFNIWNTIKNVKEQSEFTHSVLTGFFNNEKIIIPSTMSIDLKEDTNKFLEILPSLSGLSEDEQKAFQEEFKLPTVKNTYSTNIDGQKIRIVLLPEIKENFEKIKEMPKTIRNKNTINKIISNPVGFLPNKNIVSLENLSERIVNLGDFHAINANNENSHIDWQYPFELDLYNISGKKEIKLKINDKEDMENFTECLDEAIVNEYAYFEFNDITIPLTPLNFEILKPFVESMQKSKIDTNNAQKGKKVKLINNKDEKIELIITDEIFEDLKSQIRKIREYNVNDNATWNIQISEDHFPLTPENMKQLKEVFEIHFLIGEFNETTKADFNELLYNSYCNVDLEIPHDLKYGVTLKKYQKKGLAWLENSFKMKEVGRKGVLLADDMGLGKTLQILSFIHWLKDKEQYNNKYFNTQNKKPILIVAPVILLDNWANEYHKFFNGLFGEPLVLHGENLRRLKIREGKEYYQFKLSTCEATLHLDIDEIKTSNIVITNYDTLVNYEFSFASIDWSVVVLDEAQEIKETASHKSRVAKGIKADFKIACTGTPVENSLTDLWNIFDFLQPQLLGSLREFKSAYNSEIMNDDKYNEIRNRLYYEKPYAYILRREKRIDLKGELPPKTEEIYRVPLQENQIQKYEELKRTMSIGLPEDKLKAFANMNKLSQHPRLLSNNGNYSIDSLVNECAKFKKLIDVIETIKQKNEKVIIFCIFLEIQKYLKLVLENKFGLDNIDIINGAAKNRQRLIDNFQKENDKFNILILSPLAAGVGLNIVGANHVIHYGRWWNPAKENQATDRVYRIGQNKEVHVHYLIDIYPDNSTRTFDEKLHELIMKKIEVAHNFLLPNNIDIEKELFAEFEKK